MVQLPLQLISLSLCIVKFSLKSSISKWRNMISIFLLCSLFQGSNFSLVLLDSLLLLLDLLFELPGHVFSALLELLFSLHIELNLFLIVPIFLSEALKFLFHVRDLLLQ